MAQLWKPYMESQLFLGGGHSPQQSSHSFLIFFFFALLLYLSRDAIFYYIPITLWVRIYGV